MLIAASLIREWHFFFSKPSRLTLLYATFAVLTLIIYCGAPFVGHPLIPVVAIGIAVFVIANGRTAVSCPRLARGLLALFIASCLLPTFYQFQIKPWRWPPYKIAPGVLHAQLAADWPVRDGG